MLKNIRHWFCLLQNTVLELGSASRWILVFVCVCVWVCNRLQPWTFSINITIQPRTYLPGGTVHVFRSSCNCSAYASLQPVNKVWGYMYIRERPRLEVVYYNVYVRGCQKFHPHFIGKVRVVCPRYWLLRPRYCSYKHTLTHSHTDTHTSSILRPRSKAITRMYVCVCAWIHACMCVVFLLSLHVDT